MSKHWSLKEPETSAEHRFHGKNFYNKIKKSGKAGQHKKTLRSVFVFIFPDITKF